MKDNEITSFDKELNEFLQPKCLIIQETPSLNGSIINVGVTPLRCHFQHYFFAKK